jgi:FkbM family methyltransferase
MSTRQLKKNILYSVIIIIFLFYYFHQIKRKYVFIDGGANWGQATVAFKSTKLYKKFPWKIYAIEANPNLITKIPKESDTTIINKAMWVYDGTMDFYYSDHVDTGEEYYVCKKGECIQKKIVIPCFDFGKWIKNNFNKKDYIIFSLDISGGEWEILEKMISDGSIEYIDRLYVEFCTDKFVAKGHSEDEAYEREYAIIHKVRELGIIFDRESAEEVIWRRNTWQDNL